jgi:hypothetical protein
MYLKVARTITSFVILLMALEILGAAATASPSTSDYTITLRSEKSKASIFGYFLFEKAEEEIEKTEEEKDGIPGVVLVDFSLVAGSLSFYHTPQVLFVAFTSQYDVRPPLHQLNCVFLI